MYMYTKPFLMHFAKSISGKGRHTLSGKGRRELAMSARNFIKQIRTYVEVYQREYAIVMYSAFTYFSAMTRFCHYQLE